MLLCCVGGSLSRERLDELRSEAMKTTSELFLDKDASKYSLFEEI